MQSTAKEALQHLDRWESMVTNNASVLQMALKAGSRNANSCTRWCLAMHVDLLRLICHSMSHSDFFETKQTAKTETQELQQEFPGLVLTPKARQTRPEKQEQLQHGCTCLAYKRKARRVCLDSGKIKTVSHGLCDILSKFDDAQALMAQTRRYSCRLHLFSAAAC